MMQGNQGFSSAELAEESSRAIVVKAEREYDGLTMVVPAAEAQKRLQQLQAFVHSVMVENVDYGVIPGTEKPCLYQPGAQKLAEVYGFAHRFEPLEAVKDWGKGFFYFEYRCILSSRRDGSVIGEGIGSCNSQESKYAGRWVPEHEVPGMNKAALKQKTESAWLFESKLPPGVDKSKLPRQQRTGKKGPYTVFQLVVTQYQIPNIEIASLVNTLQKMACKRAYVHAVIAATRSSGLLTQDMEDLPPEAFGEVRSEPAHDPKTGEVVSPFGALADTVLSARTLDELRMAKTGVNAQIRSMPKGTLSDAELAELKRIGQAQVEAIAARQRRAPENLDAEPPPEDASMQVGDDPGGLS